MSWEVLGVLRPDEPDYRERLEATRAQIDRAVPERLARGALALKRGDLDAAAAQYLAALALQPDHAGAADALRAIERERNRRLYLGKPSRLTLTRQSTLEARATARPGRSASGSMPASMATPTSVSASSLATSMSLPSSMASMASSSRSISMSTDRNDVEHAALLAAQGELDDAVGLLEQRLATQRGDADACRLLAELKARQAVDVARPAAPPAAFGSRGRGPELDATSARVALRAPQSTTERSPTAPTTAVPPRAANASAAAFRTRSACVPGGTGAPG